MAYDVQNIFICFSLPSVHLLWCNIQISCFLFLWLHHVACGNLSSQHPVLTTGPPGKLILPFENWHQSFPGGLCMSAKLLQLRPTLCSCMDYSLPGSSLYGIPQARIWGGLPCPLPGDLPNPGIEPVSLIGKYGVICISEVIDIAPGNLNSSLCFIQPGISHDVLCI